MQMKMNGHIQHIYPAHCKALLAALCLVFLVTGIKAINLNQIQMQKKLDEQNKTLEAQRILIGEMQKEIEALKKK